METDVTPTLAADPGRSVTDEDPVLKTMMVNALRSRVGMMDHLRKAIENVESALRLMRADSDQHLCFVTQYNEQRRQRQEPIGLIHRTLRVDLMKSASCPVQFRDPPRPCVTNQRGQELLGIIDSCALRVTDRVQRLPYRCRQNALAPQDLSFLSWIIGACLSEAC